MIPRTDKRPVNLSLWHFQFPLNALVSISHRISGVVLILTLFIWLFLLNQMLFVPDDFAKHQAWLSSIGGQIFLSLFWLALWFHWLAGIRHLLIEFCLNSRIKTALRTHQAALGNFILWGFGALLILARIWL